MNFVQVNIYLLNCYLALTEVIDLFNNFSSSSFQYIWYYIGKIIDFENCPGGKDGLGQYYIRSIYANLGVAVRHEMNASEETRPYYHKKLLALYDAAPTHESFANADRDDFKWVDKPKISSIARVDLREVLQQQFKSVKSPPAKRVRSVAEDPFAAQSSPAGGNGVAQYSSRGNRDGIAGGAGNETLQESPRRRGIPTRYNNTLDEGFDTNYDKPEE